MNLPAIDTTVILRKKDFIGKNPHVDVFVVVKKILAKSVLVQLQGSQKEAYIPSKWFGTKASDLTAHPPIISLPTWYNIICTDELDAVYPSELELAGRLDSKETTKKNIPMETPVAPIVKSTVTETVPLIYSKILAVQEEIGAIGKNRTADDNAFAFRGIEDIINAISPQFKKHRIFMTTDVLSCQNSVAGKCIVNVKFTFFAEDGSSIHSTVCGEGFSKTNKETTIALSIAHRIALTQTFSISTDERPFLEQKQFQKALLRMGEIGLLDKLKKEFRIKEAHLSMLQEAAKKHQKK